MSIYTPPNLVLHNANVLTVDKKNPKAEAVGITGSKISFVGQNSEIRSVPSNPSTRHIDLEGKTVVPGFIDSHVHLVQRGLQLSELDLQDTSSIDDVLGKLNAKVKETEKGEWIIGCGWDETGWSDGRFITRRDIDSVAPEHPVILKRICMHLWVLNSRAIEVLNTPTSPEGIDLQTGCINVSLRGDVNEMFKGCLDPTEEALQDALQRAQTESIRLGVTSVHDMTPNLDTLKRADERGQLLISNYACTSFDCGIIPSSDTLRIGAVKVYADGSLGARTAALRGPYNDDESALGTLTWTQQELDNIVAKAHSAGGQVAIHAIGDRAVDAALNAIEKSLKTNPRSDHRHRIEHCELVDGELISRIRDLNIIVSAQPNFTGRWGGRGGLYEKRLGSERWQMLNPLAQFKNKGIKIAFGSDGMPFGPMYGIWSCVNHPVKESRLSPEDALNYYTSGGAYASFEETNKGTIEVGKLADVVVLSDDITSIPHSDIKDTSVVMTIVGGKVYLDMSGDLSG